MKAVRWASVLSRTMSGMSSSSRRSPVSGAQMTPEVWRTKKAIFSGVADSAAMMRSPSFSRSSSSTTTTISPRAMAAMASGMAAKPSRVSFFTVMADSPAGRSWLTSRGWERERRRRESSWAESRRSAYLAMTSTSRFTGSPTPLWPRVVTAAVCGMTATVKPSSSTSTTVRLMPSTVIEPFSTT